MATATAGHFYASENYSFFRKLQLHEIKQYEQSTRNKSGLRTGGRRITDSATENFMKYILNETRAYLKTVKAETPERYLRILTGEEGVFLGVKINLLKYIKSRMLSEAQILESAAPDAVKRKNGLTIPYDNAYRKLRYMRAKITMNRSLSHSNGVVSNGMDFIKEWSGVNASGAVDPSGRSAHIAYVNLKYIFGKDWYENQIQKIENQAFEEDQKNNYTEKISARVINNNIEKLKAEKELSGKNENEAAKQQPTENQNNEAAKPKTNAITEDQQDAKSRQQGSPLLLGDFLKKMPVLQPLQEKIKEDQPPVSAAPPTTDHAAALWEMLQKLAYLPFIETGQVRINAAEQFYGKRFSHETAQKAICNFRELLRHFPYETLEAAIKAQAKYLTNGRDRFIYTPGKYLDTSMKMGNIVAAIKRLLPPEKPVSGHVVMEDDMCDRQRINLLYRKLLERGCDSTQISTFKNWCHKKGIVYMDKMVQLFIRKYDQATAKGAKYGDVFPGGNSRAFAGMVKRGFEKNTAPTEDQRVEMRRKIRAEVNHQKWQAPMEAVRRMPLEDRKRLLALCAEVLGAQLTDLWMQRENLVLLAYCHVKFN